MIKLITFLLAKLIRLVTWHFYPILFWYLIGSLLEWNFNPAEWGVTRDVMTAFYVITIIYKYIGENVPNDIDEIIEQYYE